MTQINQVYEFAPGVAAQNILSNADYLASGTRNTGHLPGIALQVVENAALRNLSRFCRGVAAFIAARHAPGVVDDGDPAKIVAGLEAAILDMVLDNPLAVAAGGTANALTAALPNSPQTALADKMQLSVRAAAANTSTTPTLNLTLGAVATGAKTIVKGALSPLAAGDIAGAGAVLLLQYNATADKWVLLNAGALPANIAYLDVVQAYTRQQSPAQVSRIGVSGTQAVDLYLHQLLYMVANGALAIADPTHMLPGETCVLLIYNSTASVQTLSWGTAWHGTSLGGLPTSLAPGKLAMFSFMCVTTPTGTYMVPFGQGQEA